MNQKHRESIVGNCPEQKSNIMPVVNVATDREACPKFWYAAQVRSCCERTVAKKLSLLGITTYVPLRKETRQWSDRKKKISVVLMPMIVLLNVEPQKIPEIKKLSFIYDILKFPGHNAPAIIPSEQIYKLKLMVEFSNGQVEFTPTDFKAGDNVTICRGDLKGVSGTIKEDSNGKVRIGIIIDLLGCAIAEIPISDLKLINHQ